jgi:hypothetical protein
LCITGSSYLTLYSYEFLGQMLSVHWALVMKRYWNHMFWPWPARQSTRLIHFQWRWGVVKCLSETLFSVMGMNMKFLGAKWNLQIFKYEFCTLCDFNYYGVPQKSSIHCLLSISVIGMRHCTHPTRFLVKQERNLVCIVFMTT